MSLLEQPLKLGAHVLPTRIVMAPIATQRCDGDGHATNALFEYYRRRSAAGGLGAIIVEHAFVHTRGRLSPKQLGAYDASCAPGFAQLSHTIHAASPNGTLALLQLSHAGSLAFPADLERGVFGPSPLVHPGHKRFNNTGIVAQELSGDDISHIVRCFAQAARLALDAGFDGVEIHAAHGYLLDQFYSPLTNKRRDVYGSQSIENRARMTCEVVQTVRDAVGPQALIAVRLGPHDYTPGGADRAEGPVFARLLVDAGADLLDVSGGLFNFGRHDTRPPGFFRAASSLVRSSVEVPVITAGGVHYPPQAEWLLQTQACDLVGVGRALMRQPTWAANALEELRGTDDAPSC